MKLKVITGLVLTVFLASTLTITLYVHLVGASEPPATEWNRTYGGTDDDQAFSVRQTSDGGYIIAGLTYSFGAGSCDAWLVKTDTSGNMVWNKAYGGTSWDDAKSVVQTSDGGYIIAGYTYSFGAGGGDFWLVKTDSNGEMVWNKTYGGTDDDYAYSVQQTIDAGYIIAGLTESFGAGWEDFWLVKTDSNGEMVWNKTYGGTGNDWAFSVQQTSDGGYVIAGLTGSVVAVTYQQDFWLIKVAGPPQHELVMSITAPASLQLGGSSPLDAIVTNEGLNDEANVELALLINGTILNSTTIPILQAGNSYTLSYLWTPTVEGTYNITAYAHPVPGEASVENNQMTKFVTVAEIQVGVKAGDWITIDYTITGWPAGTPYPEWLKLEFLSVEGTTATVRVTMRMSNGTEQSETVPVDVLAGGQAFGLSGFVIPANSKVGDSINMGGAGFTFTVTIDDETTRTYAGARRTVVYTSFSQDGTQLTYYWDKQTGVMVEASVTSGSMTATAKATETSMWQAAPFWMQWWLWAIVAVVIIALAGAVYFIKKRKPPTPTAPAIPTESTLQNIYPAYSYHNHQ